MANFQPFISTKSAQKSLFSYVRELEGVHARIPQLDSSVFVKKETAFMA